MPSIIKSGSQVQPSLHRKTLTAASQDMPSFKLYTDRLEEVAPVSKIEILSKNSPFQGCKHAELISYKVHKEQFKSLLVPNGSLSGVKVREK